jgi:hypothetical protein
VSDPREQERENRAAGYSLAAALLSEWIANLADDVLVDRRGSILAAFDGQGYAVHDPYAAFAEIQHGSRTFHVEIREKL